MVAPWRWPGPLQLQLLRAATRAFQDRRKASSAILQVAETTPLFSRSGFLAHFATVGCARDASLKLQAAEPTTLRAGTEVDVRTIRSVHDDDIRDAVPIQVGGSKPVRIGVDWN